MAFEVIKVNGYPVHSNYKEFQCKSEADISKLPRYGVEGTQTVFGDPSINEPCAIGSTAFVEETLNAYLLSVDNVWMKL